MTSIRALSGLALALSLSGCSDDGTGNYDPAACTGPLVVSGDVDAATTWPRGTTVHVKADPLKIRASLTVERSIGLLMCSRRIFERLPGARSFVR